MSHYTPYPAYKNSGVEWLGRVPEGWIVKRLRYSAELNPSVPRALLREPDAEVSFVPMECVGEDGSIELDRTRAVVDVKDGYSFFENGDVVFAKVTPCFENGKHAVMRNLVGGVGFGTTELTVLRATMQTDVGFVSYIVQSERFRQLGAGAMTGAGGLKRVPDEFTRNFVSGWPTKDEQLAIAAHLDRETVRLDGLVAKKTRFIELLREKRQALITHAVTKGLDPTVKMKDSNVEWLGQVPEHWDVTVLKYIVATIEQGWSPECEARPADENEWGVLKVGCVNSGVFNDQQNKALPPDLKPEPSLALRAGDVLVSRANTRDLVGSCAVLERDFPFLMICDKLYRLRVNARVIPNFLGLMIRVYGRRDIEVEANGASSSMVNIAQSVIMNLRVNVPPVAEQAEIVAQIVHATIRLDALIEKTERSIALIKERRAALITAAVTGQIDLRAAA